jgi:molybdopterin/thiamine biosynthesis adenylyltransferase
MNGSNQDRFARQVGLVPGDKLQPLAVTVIGVGAIGRQVAVQLASLGVRQITLIDFDHVEEVNVTTQGYLHDDIGKLKVLATAQAVSRIDTSIEVSLIETRYRPGLPVGDAVFCCVDSITARSAIWRSAGKLARCWVDGRMLGEVMRILTVTEEQGRDYYPTTLFAQAEAVSGACTARGVIYTAAIAAGLMTQQFTRWLRGLPTDNDLSLNLLASELTVNEATIAAS